MTHTYRIEGMTCNSCRATVQNLLSAIPGVQTVLVDLGRSEAEVEMSRHIPLSELQHALEDHPRYKITVDPAPGGQQNANGEQGWWRTYRPVLLIFAFITVISLSSVIVNGPFDIMEWMRYFMAGFFLTFSFFKFLDLRGFADSYATYDLIARKWRGWGYVYATLEFLLGMAFLTGFDPLLTNGFTFILMSVSLGGVLKALFQRRAIRCACLGAVFNLPMSTITVIEDALMILMSAGMIIYYIS